jgi:hypothetical protein
MKKSTKIYLAVAAVGLLIAGVQDVMNLETSGLRQAHQAVAWEKDYSSSVECEHMKDGGETWALCRFWRTAPSVWLKRGDTWAAANGPALMVIDWVAQIDTSNAARPYQDLPRLYVDRQQPVYMTDPVRARMDEIRVEIAASR